MELISIARNPVPSGAVVGMFKGYDGEALRFARWDATVSPRRGTICCFTGRTEYIEKYFETISDLRRRGFCVAIFDWRGQGGSYRPIDDPYKGHIKDFSEYDRDLICFMKEVVLPDCPPPFGALAHSMGGNMVLRNITRPGSWFDRAVLLAPMIELHPALLGFAPILVRSYAQFACYAGFGQSYVHGGTPEGGAIGDFETNILTSDRERHQRNYMLEQAVGPLFLGSPTVAWLKAAMESMTIINHPDFIGKVNVPTLLFAAGQDVIVPSRAVEDYAARLKSGSGILLSEAKHEILQENDSIRSRFWAAFDAYFGIVPAETRVA
ncbi:MAG: alpha/beta fold hydrolase [Hyphomicrobiaceae bacterium]